MKAFFFLTLLLCVHQLHAQTQMEMTEQSGAEYEKADSALNQIYQQILKNNSSDTAFVHNFKAAERIWIQFRDAEMKMKYPDRADGYYGSVFPMCWNIYLTQLTNDRIKTLNEWITGVEEGDVCSGTVPIKH